VRVLRVLRSERFQIKPPPRPVMNVTRLGIGRHRNSARHDLEFRLKRGNAPMLSKCANPDCGEKFRFLHEGQIFRLSPTPELQPLEAALSPLFNERFWLCDRCAETMTVIWDGTHAKVVQRTPPCTAPDKDDDFQEDALREDRTATRQKSSGAAAKAAPA